MAEGCFCADNAYALKGLCECEEPCSCECEVCDCQQVDLWSVDLKESNSCGCVQCTCQEETHED
jgi:hypothetical protein